MWVCRLEIVKHCVIYYLNLQYHSKLDDCVSYFQCKLLTVSKKRNETMMSQKCSISRKWWIEHVCIHTHTHKAHNRATIQDIFNQVSSWTHTMISSLIYSVCSTLCTCSIEGRNCTLKIHTRVKTAQKEFHFSIISMRILTKRWWRRRAHHYNYYGYQIFYLLFYDFEWNLNVFCWVYNIIYLHWLAISKWLIMKNNKTSKHNNIIAANTTLVLKNSNWSVYQIRLRKWFEQLLYFKIYA